MDLKTLEERKAFYEEQLQSQRINMFRLEGVIAVLNELIELEKQPPKEVKK